MNNNNMSDLSRDELLALLAKKDAEGEKEKKGPQCTYKATRGDRARCTSHDVSPWGVCNKHAGTIQGKNAKKMYDEEKERAEAKAKEALDAEEKEKLIKEAEEEEKVAKAKIRAKRAVSDQEEPKVEKKTPQKVEKTKKKPHTEEEHVEEEEEHTEKKKHVEVEKHTEKKKHVKKEKHPGDEPIKEKVVIRVEPNDFGNFEHKKTGIVFDLETKKAYGVQRKNGSIAPLSKHHIEICKTNKWPYQIPSYYEESDEGDEEVEPESDEEKDEGTDEEEPEEPEEEGEIEEFDDASEPEEEY